MPRYTSSGNAVEGVIANSSAALIAQASAIRRHRASGIWTHWRCVLMSSSELSIGHVLGLAPPPMSSKAKPGGVRSRASALEHSYSECSARRWNPLLSVLASLALLFLKERYLQSSRGKP